MAISPDSLQTLGSFAQQRGIEFLMLSDPGGQTIRRYGIWDESATGRTAGIPHPGFFVLDSSGIVRARIFNEGYRVRPSSDELIDAARALH